MAHEMKMRIATLINDHRHTHEPIALARMILEAMREPTKDMEEAADDLGDWGVPSDPGAGHACALSHWTAMIDVAIGKAST